jgi:predicted amidohydrolase
MTHNLVVGLVQMGLHPDDDPAALAEAEDKSRRAAARGAKLICLPEHWLISRVLREDDEIYERFGGLARDLGVHINLGGVYERKAQKEGGGGIALVSPTISPSGSVVARQKKVHLYRGEKRKATPGDRFEVFRIGDAAIGVMVCHDVVFPESARTLVLSGAELLIVPSLIVSEGLEPWRIYLEARALENRVPVISTNAYYPPRFLGGSMVVDLDYNRKERIMSLEVSVAPTGEGVLVETIGLGALAEMRRERLAERRPGAYTF